MPEDHVFALNSDERWLLCFTTLKGAAYGYTSSQKSKHPRIILDARIRGPDGEQEARARRWRLRQRFREIDPPTP